MITFLLLFFLFENISFLDSLYQIGDYERVLKEGEVILTQELKKGERVEVLKTMAFAAVALGDEEKGKDYFLSLLQISPNFFLDPIKTSPKILRVFQIAREEFKKKKREIIKYSSLVYFYPGLFQLKEGKKFRGYFLTSLTTVSAVGLFASVVLTPIFHRSYLEKRIPSEIESAYYLYKFAYLAQQVFGITIGLSYTYHLLDLKLSE
ncbi:MAG: hypothetical protein ABIK84_00240 [candidate division WOR-3 bacterium]